MARAGSGTAILALATGALGASCTGTPQKAGVAIYSPPVSGQPGRILRVQSTEPHERPRRAMRDSSKPLGAGENLPEGNDPPEPSSIASQTSLDVLERIMDRLLASGDRISEGEWREILQVDALTSTQSDPQQIPIVRNGVAGYVLAFRAAAPCSVFAGDEFYEGLCAGEVRQGRIELMRILGPFGVPDIDGRETGCSYEEILSRLADGGWSRFGPVNSDGPVILEPGGILGADHFLKDRLRLDIVPPIPTLGVCPMSITIYQSGN